MCVCGNVYVCVMKDVQKYGCVHTSHRGGSYGSIPDL